MCRRSRRNWRNPYRTRPPLWARRRGWFSIWVSKSQEVAYHLDASCYLPLQLLPAISQVAKRVAQQLLLLADSIVPGPGAWGTWGVFTALWAESGSTQPLRPTGIQNPSDAQQLWPGLQGPQRHSRRTQRRCEEMWSQDVFTSICEFKLLLGAEWGWWLLEQTRDRFGVLTDMSGWIYMGRKRKYILLHYSYSSQQEPCMACGEFLFW